MLEANFIIENVDICLGDGRLIQGEILISAGRIIEVIEGKSGIDCQRFDGQGCTVLPGFIDIHIHGADGADFMDGTSDAAERIARFLPAEGTTSFLATTITQSPEEIGKAIEANREFISSQKAGMAEMLGFHLEGPFIHPEQAGAQPKQYITKPDISLLEDWFGTDLKDLKIVTLAPDMDTGHVMIKHLESMGIISSAGHTKASFEEIKTAVDHGLSHLTHFTNAMTGIHHREIGTVGAGFMDERLYCELIADGIHMSKDMIKMIAKFIDVKRLILITDSMRAKGLADGEYTLGGQPVKVAAGKAVLNDGTLAGSVLKMNEALRIMGEAAEFSFYELQLISSQNAAKRMGVFHRKGSIERGKDADLVLLDDQFQVSFTFCKGRLAYTKHPTY